MANRAALLAAAALAGCAAPAFLGAEIAGVHVDDPGERAQTLLDDAEIEVPLVSDSAGELRGTIAVGGATFGVRVERPEGFAPRLVVDRAGDGSFAGVFAGQSLPSRWIEAEVDLVLPGPRDYRVDLAYTEADGAPRLSMSPWQLEFGEADLGGRRFRYVVRDRSGTGSFADRAKLDLVFDRDGDGCFDGGGGGEEVRADGSFNLGTGTFVVRSVSEDGKRVAFAPALVPRAPTPFVGVGDAAPALDGKDLDGEPVSLSGYRDRDVLLVFWATWCGPCRQELEQMAKGWRRFRRNFDGDVLGVCVDDDVAAAHAFAEEARVPFRSVSAPGGWDGATAKAYGVRMIPIAVLVGADGRVKERRVFATRYLDER